MILPEEELVLEPEILWRGHGLHHEMPRILELITPRTGDVSAPMTQPTRLALLVHPAVARPRGLHPRDTLLAMFWPEFDTQRAAG